MDCADRQESGRAAHADGDFAHQHASMTSSSDGASLLHQASMARQAKALLRKSAVFQARNLCTNLCVVSAPALFCILLLALKAGVQQLMAGDEYRVRQLQVVSHGPMSTLINWPICVQATCLRCWRSTWWLLAAGNSTF